ncbi:MAG: transposase [Paracoccaceae bacterium]
MKSIPAIGAITTTSFVTTVEDSMIFRESRSVGNSIALTTRRYQFGEIYNKGRILRRGDAHLRSLLYDAATVVLTRRTSADSAL